MADPISPAGPRGNPFFTAWARLVLRHRWLFLLLTVLWTAGGAVLAAKWLEVDTSVESFAASADPSQIVLEEYRDEFGRDGMFLVLIEGDVFSAPYLEQLRKLHKELAGLDMEIPSLGERKADRLARKGKGPPPTPKKKKPKAAVVDDAFGGDDGWGDSGWGDEAGGSVVDEIISLINARRTRGSEAGIEVGELMDPFPSAADLPALKAEVLADKFLVGQVVGKAGRHSVISVRTQFMNEADTRRVNERIAEIAKTYEAPGFHVMVSGLPALDAALNSLLLTDLGRMLGLSLVLMVVVLLVLFRHPIGVIAPLAVVGLAAGNTFGMMAATGMPVTMLSNILPAFLFCVGIGDSVHLISVYRDGMKSGLSSHDAIVAAVGTTGVPVLFTSLTTMVGLLSFNFATLTAIQQMGMAGAFGVLMACLHSMVVLPIALSFNKKSLMGARGEGTHDFIDTFLERCRELSGVADDDGTGPEPAAGRRRRLRTLAVGVLLMGVAAYGTSTLRVWHNPISWFPDDQPVKVAFDAMDDNIGGTASVQLLIDGPEGVGLKDRELLLGLEKLVEHIRTYEDADVGPIVGNAISVIDVVRETNQALNAGDPAFYKIPDTDRGVADMLFMFENAGPDQLSRLATNDLSRGQVTIRIRWLEATAYEPLIAHIRAGIDKYIPQSAETTTRVQPTGSIYTLVSTIATLLGDLLRSFGVAFLVITFIMAFLLRSVRLGLVAMVPNLMPILFIMGLMGFAGIPIDMNNLLIASIAIGIAVDDTIHFLHHYQLGLRRTNNVEQAIRSAMRHAGRAMVSTSIILALGFFAYLGATMFNIQRFGLLIGLTAIMALLIDLIFTPALLRTIDPRSPTKEPTA